MEKKLNTALKGGTTILGAGQIILGATTVLASAIGKKAFAAKTAMACAVTVVAATAVAVTREVIGGKTETPDVGEIYNDPVDNSEEEKLCAVADECGSGEPGDEEVFE